MRCFMVCNVRPPIAVFVCPELWKLLYVSFNHFFIKCESVCNNVPRLAWIGIEKQLVQPIVFLLIIQLFILFRRVSVGCRYRVKFRSLFTDMRSSFQWSASFWCPSQSAGLLPFRILFRIFTWTFDYSWIANTCHWCFFFAPCFCDLKVPTISKIK